MSLAGWALLIVDMQNAYCDPQGEFARSAADPLACARAVEPCARLRAAARAGGVPVLYAVKVGLDERVPTAAFHAAAPRFPSALRKGTWSAAIVEALRPGPGEIVIEKLGFSAFFDTPLEAALRRMAVQRLVLAGVTTSICVESTVRDAVQHGFETYVVRDATAEWDSARHARSLDQLAYAFARVVGLDELVAAWSAGEARG
jgi:ureidoacrylate peracid hydrolase